AEALAPVYDAEGRIADGGPTRRAIDLSGASAQRADLPGAQLARALALHVDFADATPGDSNLNGADLRKAQMTSARLEGADLQGSDFSGANLAGASLSGAQLGGANFAGADLRGAIVDPDMRAMPELAAAIFAAVSRHAPEDLAEVLRRHELWVRSEGREGLRADLSDFDFAGQDLRGINLMGALLERA